MCKLMTGNGVTPLLLTECSLEWRSTVNSKKTANKYYYIQIGQDLINTWEVKYFHCMTEALNNVIPSPELAPEDKHGVSVFRSNLETLPLPSQLCLAARRLL